MPLRHSQTCISRPTGHPHAARRLSYHTFVITPIVRGRGGHAPKGNHETTTLLSNRTDAAASFTGRFVRSSVVQLLVWLAATTAASIPRATTAESAVRVGRRLLVSS